MAQYALADRLHKTIGEIEQMPVDEFVHWLAYLRIIDDGS